MATFKTPEARLLRDGPFHSIANAIEAATGCERAIVREISDGYLTCSMSIKGVPANHTIELQSIVAAVVNIVRENGRMPFSLYEVNCVEELIILHFGMPLAELVMQGVYLHNTPADDGTLPVVDGVRQLPRVKQYVQTTTLDAAVAARINPVLDVVDLIAKHQQRVAQQWTGKDMREERFHKLKRTFEAEPTILAPVAPNSDYHTVTMAPVMSVTLLDHVALMTSNLAYAGPPRLMKRGPRDWMLLTDVRVSGTQHASNVAPPVIGFNKMGASEASPVSAKRSPYQ